MFRHTNVAGSASSALGALAQAAGQSYPQDQTRPKEIGLIQRIEGVRSGLDQIHTRLFGLGERIAGGANAEKNPAPAPAGIPGNLTVSEERIRQIFNLLDSFESTF